MADLELKLGFEKSLSCSQNRRRRNKRKKSNRSSRKIEDHKDLAFMDKSHSFLIISNITSLYIGFAELKHDFLLL